MNDPAESPLPARPEAPRGFLRTHGKVKRLVRRITGRPAQQQLLPVLIKVYAGFSKFDGVASEDEIESSLGFMRGDYPDAVYSELQSLYRQALRETQEQKARASSHVTITTGCVAVWGNPGFRHVNSFRWTSSWPFQPKPPEGPRSASVR